jgi:type II secretory pathway pseudopilin PulG
MNITKSKSGFKYFQGFSLVEVLLVVSVSSLVGVLLLSVFTQNNGLFIQQSARVAQGLSKNDAFTEISESIKYAASIVPLSQGNPQYVTGLETIVLALPAIDAQGNVIDQTFDHLIISKDPQNPKILRKLLQKDDESARVSENKVLVTKLSKINFYYLDQEGKSVTPTSATKVNFVLNLNEATGLNRSEDSSSSSQVNLRNN